MIVEGTPEFQRGFDLSMSEPVLDGQEYQPAPWLVPDEHVGFDGEGNFHCVPEALNRHQLTHRMINHILGDIEHPYGSTNRDDEFYFTLSEIEEQNGLPDEFEIVYGIFRDNYNGGQDG